MATHWSILAWKNPTDRGTWRATVHGIAKSQTWLSDFTHTVGMTTVSTSQGYRVNELSEMLGQLLCKSLSCHQWRETQHYLSQQSLMCSVAQLCLTLWDPMVCSPPGSSVHGILQAGILEWVAFPLLQGILPTQGSNSGLPCCKQILYQLNRLSINISYMKKHLIKINS